ncbi:WSC domain-containing protein [Podospora didyma]|uniref:WSC domain-containing protein n=1 Tax=Podospora didyma TaxID=330526 RepID=A0AAE0NZN0_9PEZI|nr:WSC domain-containing protein [Podospora didyma]
MDTDMVFDILINAVTSLMARQHLFPPEHKSHRHGSWHLPLHSFDSLTDIRSLSSDRSFSVHSFILRFLEMFVKGVVLAALASGATAHVAAWAKGMYCKGGNNASVDEQNTNTAVVPLYNLPFEDFWMQHDRGCDKVPPPNGESLELPAGGRFKVELAHNRGQTTLSFDGRYTSDWPDGETHTEPWTGANAGDCLSDGIMHAQSYETAAGTAFAISYHSNISEVNINNTVVFSVAANTPWKRETWYDVPADMPPCPVGGCYCAWLWVPQGCGIRNEYMQNFKCHVTGSTSTKALGIPQAPVWCGDDPSKCVTGPKQIVVYNQLTGNNVNPPSGATPAYSGKTGFNPGAQTDIFVGDEANTPPPAVYPKGNKYLGCYTDSGSPRVLAVMPQIGESLTPQICVQSCTKMAYKYAGLEDGHECWCGLTAPALSLKVAESQCSKQCTGSVQTCGAGGFIEVYSTGVTAPLPPVTPPPASWTAAGCYYDPVTPRALPVQKDVASPVTVASCVAACSGYAYAGVEYGHECYCGNTMAGVQQAPDTDCNIPCPGDSTVMCGSGGRINVYKYAPSSSSTSATSLAATSFSASTILSTSVKSSTSTTLSASVKSSSTVKSSTPSTVSVLPTPTPTTVSWLYICQYTNWAAPCSNVQVKHSASCVTFKNTSFYHNFRSAGPDTGKCVLYNSDNCATGVENYTLAFPGVTTFGNQNAHWGSVKCFLN